MLLAGVRVVACEIGLAGPLCTRLLADLGADVVKVEAPGRGDVTRGWDTIAGGLSSGFVWVNRGKRSVELDVHDDADRAALERLVRGADVFLQNFTPGWAARVGLDEPSLRALRADLVYVEISGYGADGPYAHRNAYDLVMQGETGLVSLTGTPEDPARVGVSVCDLGAGSYAAVATLAALVRRAQTGEGAHVEVSLFDTMLDWLGYFPHLWWHRGELPARTGLHHPLFCPYGPYRAGDGRLVSIAVLSPAHWERLCRDVLGRPELAAEERFATNEARAAARGELEPLLEEALAAAGAAEWAERLEAAGIPCGLVRDVGEVMAHPQLAASGLLATVGSPAGPLPTIGVPFRIDGRRPDPGDVPALGEHTDALGAPETS
jgi:crotonobetainyl-CoA:carnitine CoA-transferase CaiB-like acyl-CoA transferase